MQPLRRPARGPGRRAAPRGFDSNPRMRTLVEAELRGLHEGNFGHWSAALTLRPA